MSRDRGMVANIDHKDIGRFKRFDYRGNDFVIYALDKERYFWAYQSIN